MSEALGVTADLRDPARRSADAQRLHLAYGLLSSQFILDKMRAWMGHAGKKLLNSLKLHKETLQAVAVGVEKTQESDPTSAKVVKANVAKAMKASPASTDDMDALVNEAKS